MDLVQELICLGSYSWYLGLLCTCEPISHLVDIGFQPMAEYSR